MQQSLVSIVIPFKNTSAFIAECVESILNQTYTHWEAIFINDHSTDNSKAIVATYAKNDHRIKLYDTNGHGIIDALQLAYSYSKGTFISRMDSDDIMTTNRIEIMVKSLLRSGLGHIAIGQVKYFKKEGISEGYAKYERWINKLTATGSNFTEIYKECVIPSPCWMTYREDFEKAEAFRPNRYPEDYDLTFRFYAQKLVCTPCKTVLHLWRDYASRTSRTHEHYSQNYFLDIKLDYFLKLDYDSSRPLTVWGAGFKGKSITKQLKSKSIPFYWICDNPKKIGKEIYGCTLRSFDYLKDLMSPQSIVTVANEDAQQEIKAYFNSQDMSPMTDYFFFC